MVPFVEGSGGAAACSLSCPLGRDACGVGPCHRGAVPFGGSSGVTEDRDTEPGHTAAVCRRQRVGTASRGTRGTHWWPRVPVAVTLAGSTHLQEESP